MITETPGRSVVELIKVTKVYPPDVVALQDVSLSVLRGEMLFLTGMSGAGKTTMLKLMCHIESPTSGVVEVAGRDLSRVRPSGIQKMRQKIGVAYQDFRLLPKQTALENIAMAMEVAYHGRPAIRRRVEELLEILGIAEKRDKLVGKLSRGEQQRVALARAAANRPPLLLADEPTGNLDAAASARVVTLFNILNAEGSTIVVATHDESIYRDTSHRVLRLVHGTLIEPAAERLVDEAFPPLGEPPLALAAEDLPDDEAPLPDFDADPDDDFDLTDENGEPGAARAKEEASR
ncbi:MAG: cell division ATP-binding protein FtsE [Thermodesulfobacteriota bacterium]